MRWQLTPFSALYLNLVAIAALGLNGSCSHPTPPPTAAPTSGNTLQAEGIYGADNRHDVYREPNPALRLLADSTVLLVKNSDLNFDSSAAAHLTTRTLASAHAACSDEPFRDQLTAGYCSGFLAGPDTIVTAGHCIASERDCAEGSIVFGFSLFSENSEPAILARSQIYHCSRVLHTQVTSDGPDFAVIKLDRPALSHWPLRIRMSGEVSPGDEVVAIGHPLGLPTKIAGGAKVRSLVPGSHFVTNLDTYGGNSGSPVFHGSSLEVEGILVRGGEDFVLRPDEFCYASVRCGNDDCRGEDVTSISVIRPFLNH